MSGNGPNGAGEPEHVVLRKAGHGWVVGDENVSDLTSAMVLADLFAADQAGATQAGATQAGTAEAVEADDDTTLNKAVKENRPPRPAAPAPRASESGPHRIPTMSVGDPAAEAGEAERLAVTVVQLEHALASRVRVEQAIGVLAERHRLRPREAFDLLRKASRARGTRVAELAQDVVASTANPLLQLPDELSRTAPQPRQHTRRYRLRGGDPPPPPGRGGGLAP